MKRLLLLSTLASLSTTPLEAIPAFARRYGLSCAQCHDPVPRLNAYGERFAANGFQLAPGDTTGLVSAGDPLLRLQQTFPIAMRLDAYVRAQGGQRVGSDFQTPSVAKLLSGGQIADGVSYYAYFLLAEDGETGPLEDAWLLFHRPGGLPIDLTVGQFQIADPVWMRELRLTLEDYAILSRTIGAGAARLAYDRGIIVGAAPTGSTVLSAMLVNGNGIGPAAGGTLDDDAPKTGAVWLTQSFGPLRVGALGYLGRQRTSAGGATQTNRTRMTGPLVMASAGCFDVAGQYLWRDDTDPGFAGATGTAVRTRGGFLEALWWPLGRGGRVTLTGLYNTIDSDDGAADYETATLNVSWLRARNLRLAAEVTYDWLAEQPRAALGFTTAF